jgi:drug/metabolite transporter (DMT)-like permease
LPGIAIAGLTGIAIASYTLWDSYAVSHLLIPPLLFQWGLGACRALLLTPYAVRHWEGVRNAWQQDKWKVVFVAIFSALAYILVLIALATSPVSYVAPMRVISTLVGVLMGARFLGEGESLRRLSAAAAMVLGVIALSAG